MCPWEHYTCPLSPDPLDLCLREQGVFRLTWSWRLGSDMCTFLRETTPCYNTGSTKLWSASDFPAELTEEERLRAPFTVLQFVSVRGAEYYVVPPGGRVPVSATIAPRDRKTLILDSNRAFACKEIFYLALFEGLHILSQALNGEFRSRGP